VLLGQRPLDTEKEAGPGFLLCCKSIVDNELCPENPDVYVRATAIISGFLIKPMPDNPKASEVVYLFQVDGAGWLPTPIQNMINSYGPYGIIGIRKILTGTTQPSVKGGSS